MKLRYQLARSRIICDWRKLRLKLDALPSLPIKKILLWAYNVLPPPLPSFPNKNKILPWAYNVLDRDTVWQSFGGFVEPVLYQWHNIIKLCAVLFGNFSPQACRRIEEEF